MNQKSPVPKSTRIAALDGLRAVAILCVALFHFYSPDAKDYYINPVYGIGLHEAWPIKYGYFGVMLFFVISGFVISQTLEGVRNITDFGIRRFARLWPAMLLCSAITFGFSFIPPVLVAHTARDFLPSLTFLDPIIFNKLFGSNSFSWMDGPYWTLFVEVRFYALIAVLFFLQPVAFYRNFLVASTTVGLLYSFSIFSNIVPMRSGLSFLLIASDLPWFSFGVGCFYLYGGHTRKAFWLLGSSAAMLTLYAIVATVRPFKEFEGAVFLTAALGIFGLVLAAISVPAVKAALSNNILVAIGMSSYSLYLLHNQIGEKLIIWLGNPLGLSTAQSAIYPLIVLLVLIGVSVKIYRYWEYPANRWINNCYRKLWPD